MLSRAAAERKAMLDLLKKQQSPELASYVADAVAQAVKERDETLNAQEVLLELRAEEIARLRSDLMDWELNSGRQRVFEIEQAVAAERERLTKWQHQCLMEVCCIENGLAALRAPEKERND